MALTPKQQRFVEEYLIDFNATQAAIRAGYSAKTARAMGSENLTKPYLAAAIEAGQKSLTARAELTQEEVLRDLALVKADAMQVVFDKDGNRVMADRGAALKALELQGRHLVMFTDKQQIGGDKNNPVGINLSVSFE